MSLEERIRILAQNDESKIKDLTLRSQNVETLNIDELSFLFPPKSWETVFANCRETFKLITEVIISNKLYPYFPLNKDLFKALDLCPLNDVKVVILGQDPYHATCGRNPQANGMAFSTNIGCPVQPSLCNIYKELKNEYIDFVIPDHGDLSSWAKQGVLLLNTCLTVKPHEAGSHKKIWNGFITKIFDAIMKINPTCIYLLWGAQAQSMNEYLGKGSIKLYASHPSPFSAYRGNKNSPAFIGCRHFLQVNEHLQKNNKIPIDWNLN